MHLWDYLIVAVPHVCAVRRVDQGLLDGPCAPLLAVNGKRDDQAPIADVHILLEHGAPKTARVYPDGGHMGCTPGMKEDAIAALIAQWLREIIAP